MRSSGRGISRGLAAVLAALALTLSSGAVVAQKPGGILKIPHGDSPASMSILEESTIVSEGPMMAVFNNLVMFDQHIAAEPARYDRPRSRQRMVVERGRHDTDLQIAPGRQMA